MALLNRVTPLGEIVENPARGMFTGNRGIIHDPATRTLLPEKRWTTKAWICCVCDFKERKRDVMGANGPDGSPGWTNLFFKDDVTALAAGHRPCFECRRADADAFLAAFRDGNLMPNAKAPEIDAVLHGQRRASRTEPPQRLSMIDLPSMPDGTMVEADRKAWLLRNRQALEWSFTGYGAPQALSNLARFPITLITPMATVKTLRAGYVPAEWRGGA